jgi:hypothetical protein
VVPSSVVAELDMTEGKGRISLWLILGLKQKAEMTNIIEGGSEFREEVAGR